MNGLIERYRERLPFADDDPVVSLGEGSTPLVLAPRLSERVGSEVGSSSRERIPPARSKTGG